MNLQTLAAANLRMLSCACVSPRKGTLNDGNRQHQTTHVGRFLVVKKKPVSHFFYKVSPHAVYSIEGAIKLLAVAAQFGEPQD